MGKRSVHSHMILKNVTAVALFVLSLSFSAFATPRCGDVLLSSQITANEILATIRSIAELRIKTDLALSRGELTAPEKILAAKGNEKLEQLLALVDGMLTPKQVRRAITEEVIRLQMKDDQERTQELEIERELRTLEKENIQIRLPIFQPENSFDIETSGFIDSITYQPERERIIVVDKNFTSIVDTKTGESSRLNYSGVSMKLVDKDTYLIAEKNGDILQYNILTKNETKLSHIRYNSDRPDRPVSISPQGGWIGTSDNPYSIKIHNTKTGKLFKMIEDPNKPGFLGRFFYHFDHFVFNSHHFIDERYILVSFGSRGQYLVDLQTGQTQATNTGKYRLLRRGFIPGTQTLASTLGNTLAWADINDLAQFESKAQRKVFPENINYISYSPDGKLLFVDWGTNGSSNKEVLDVATMQPADNFDLLKAFQDTPIGPPHFDNDYFVFATGSRNSSRGRIEIWKKK